MKQVLFAFALVLGLSSQAWAISIQPHLPEKPKQGEVTIQPVIKEVVSTQPVVPQKPKQGQYNIQPVL
ncbi:MAG: hypothetical protein ACM3YO_04555 [Bacteroidota bacterium]